MSLDRHPLRLFVPALALVLGCGGGPPITSKDQLADPLARASVPSVATKGALLSVMAQGALPEPQVSVPGADGGEAVVSVNAVGLILGFAEKGVMFDVEFRDFSEGGGIVLNGKISVLANFEYVATGNEDPTADLKLSLTGHVAVSGTFSDELNLNVKLVTRFKDLSQRDGGITLRLEGTVDTQGATFTYDNEDLVVVWKKAAR